MRAMTEDWTPPLKLMTVRVGGNDIARYSCEWSSTDGITTGESFLAWLSLAAFLTRMVKRRRNRSWAPGPGLQSMPTTLISEVLPS